MNPQDQDLTQTMSEPLLFNSPCCRLSRNFHAQIPNLLAWFLVNQKEISNREILQCNLDRRRRVRDVTTVKAKAGVVWGPGKGIQAAC